MEKELIKLTGIYKSFAGVQALQNVDFTIREGEVRCLAGENGSGKWCGKIHTDQGYRRIL